MTSPKIACIQTSKSISCKLVLKKSAEKQIVLATHSIAALNEVPPEALYTIRRNAKGESEIYRVIDDYPEVKAVVEKGIMPLGEYWESGAIGGMPEQLDLELNAHEA